MLGPIFELQGWNTSHYNLNPWRGKYMWRDMERLTEKFGLPWTAQVCFPKNCVLAARVAAANAEAEWIEAFVTAAFVANFGHDRDLNDERTVREVLSTVVSDPERVLARSTAPGLRSRLRDNTERAISLGIFGAPTCMVENELFWGEEALEDAVEWAHRKTPVERGCV